MATAARASADIGLIGLAVMGQNLALNIADHGFQIAVYNRTTATTEKFVAENPNTPGGLVGLPKRWRTSSPRSSRRARSSSSSRRAADRRGHRQPSPPLEQDDIIIDGGNALWTDTIRREKAATPKSCRFIGSGVSGGEEGARFGPSLMPGGDPAS